jgi:hypothetical protein
MIEHQPSPVSLVVPMFGGIHRGLRELFAAKKKGGALKVLRRLEISAGDLARLIHNCGDLGLAHVGKRRFFTPPDMITTQEEAEAFWKTAAATLEASPSRGCP